MFTQMCHIFKHLPLELCNLFETELMPLTLLVEVDDANANHVVFSAAIIAPA